MNRVVQITCDGIDCGTVPLVEGGGFAFGDACYGLLGVLYGGHDAPDEGADPEYQAAEAGILAGLERGETSGTFTIASPRMANKDGTLGAPLTIAWAVGRDDEDVLCEAVAAGTAVIRAHLGVTNAEPLQFFNPQSMLHQFREYMAAERREMQRRADAAKPAAPKRTIEQRLALAFSRALREALPAVMHSVIVANRQETDPGICHSHDHCDANMVMAGAFEEVLGRPAYMSCDVEDGNCTEAQCAADMRLWDAAWTLARIGEFKVD